MPVLARFVVNNLRNIEQAEIQLSAGFNLFFGNNGSGKTSVLEAIHLLAMGRSFRGHLQKPLIRDGCSETAVFGETGSGLTLGVQRPLRGTTVIQVGGKRAESLAEVSYCLPLQLINSDTFGILEGNPQERRRFLDWGVFHVEQPFLQSWRRARRALQQRNSLLKANASAEEIEPWTEEFVRSAELMDRDREDYVLGFKQELASYLGRVPELSLARLDLEYGRGWEAGASLGELLRQQLPRERKYGHTLYGPHRADLHFRIGEHNAAEVLSRGQLKLLVCALKIAQARHLHKLTGRHCLFLIDDLPAELDNQNKVRVCQMLAELGCQILITGIDYEQLEGGLLGLGARDDLKLFHVKHGKIASTQAVSRHEQALQ